MTDTPEDSQRYWQIQIPSDRLPEPLFHFTTQVGIPYEDDQGNSYYDIGIVIGMEYVENRHKRIVWSYRVRYLKCEGNPSLIGLDDDTYYEESCLVADDTVIESDE